MEIYNYIKETLAELHRNSTTDKYGQIGTFNFRVGIFGDREDEVQEYIKQNPVLRIGTYGGRFGTYRAYIIFDEDIQRACSLALRTNENRLRNLNNW